MFNRGHWKQFELTDEGPRVKARDKSGKPSYSVDGADEESFATDWLMDRTIEFIDEHKDGPFAYMVSIPDPHGPDTVRAPYDTMFSDDKIEAPRTFGKDPDKAPSWAKPAKNTKYPMAQYHGMMKCIDDNMGKLIEALKERGLYDNTIVIFTADHGDLRGEHGLQNKGKPMEASAKIPFVIRWPEHIESGVQIDHAMNTTDFMPSILTMMGAQHSGVEEGRDLSGVFQGEELKGPDVTFMRGTNKSSEDTKGWIAAVTPTHKLILSDEDEAWLHDLDKDPDELQNFVKDPEQGPVLKKMAKQLKRYGEKYNDAKIKDPHTGKVLQDLL